MEAGIFFPCGTPRARCNAPGRRIAPAIQFPSLPFAMILPEDFIPPSPVQIGREPLMAEGFPGPVRCSGLYPWMILRPAFPRFTAFLAERFDLAFGVIAIVHHSNMNPRGRE